MTQVAMVLRLGGKHGYSSEHLSRLDDLLDKHLPDMKRIVLTDAPCIPGSCQGYELRHDWPGWWSKMELFRPDIQGGLFYLDLDVTPVADLSAMANVDVLCALSERGNPRCRINSSVMFLPHQYRRRIWDRWMSYGPERAMRDFRGDQDFLYAQFSPSRWQRFQTLLPGCAVSFKQDVKSAGRVPEGTKLIYFHGTPKPWDPEGALP